MGAAVARGATVVAAGSGRVGGRYPMDTLTELQTVLVREARPRA